MRVDVKDLRYRSDLDRLLLKVARPGKGKEFDRGPETLLIFLEEMSYCYGAELREAVNALRLPTIRTGSTILITFWVSG
jgi:hypothetical protein